MGRFTAWIKTTVSSITAASVASDDAFALIDNSADLTKELPVSELASLSVLTNAFQAKDADLTTLASAFTTASASGAASLDFAEDTDNGTNRVRLQGAASTADVTVTLPAVTTTLLGQDANGASIENVGAIASNVNTVATTGSTETLDLSLYAVHDCTMDQNCAFTFSNPAPSGDLTVAVLIIRGAFTPSFTNTIIEPDGAALTYGSPSTWIVWTVNGGTSYFMASAGKSFA